ncbi:UNVERIFIED_CONTAM: hypothetical protein Slati_3094500 [Sesamum latifolium]|uniref:CCHC-type domain-containing protein n=1 Tax=Sesamum latifolium TaxID=2727402 RepID=A0AAW2V006_9LAMI
MSDSVIVCYLCGKLGHIAKYCETVFVDGFVDPSANTPYGPWLRTTLPVRSRTLTYRNEDQVFARAEKSTQSIRKRGVPPSLGILTRCTGVGRRRTKGQSWVGGHMPGLSGWGTG